MKRLVPVAISLLVLCACGKKDEPPPETPPPARTAQSAPKVEPSPAPSPPPQESVEPSRPSEEKAKPAGEKYVVLKGDTLYSIAKKNGLAYRDLAKWNKIKNPRRLRVGQELRLTPPGK